MTVCSQSSPPRRYEALAYIVDAIVRTGISPSHDEIGRHMGVSKTRMRQFIGQLIAEGLIEREPGSNRGLRVRDLPQSRHIFAQALRNLGWSTAFALADVLPPCTREQLTLVAVLDHVPEDADTDHEHGARTPAGDAPGAWPAAA